jgi:hypothetical protein
MRFCEKLDFLMKITNTTNSALSLNVRLDASHISRLRRGERNALKDMSSIKTMGAYFARNCSQEYQRKALSDALNLTALPNTEKQISELIAKWLVTADDRGTRSVESFLSGLSGFSKSRSNTEVNLNSATAEFPQSGMSVYYGNEGKQKAAVYFLSEVIAREKPQTLLLFSDEPTDWMTADRAFAAQWAQLMMQVLAKGNRIKIIHTVSRDLDEMFHAITQWMPLYMSGLIEPYYYPKKKDGIFKRTLFICPDVSAVVSMSVGNTANKAANILCRDSAVIEAYTEEFNEYLSLCKPLMSIYTAKDEGVYFSKLLEFEEECSNAVMKTESLSLLTMPEKLTNEIMTRIGKLSDFGAHQKERVSVFENCLKSNTFTEIIRLFDTETVKNEQVKVSFSDMLIGGATYYTAEEYIEHLEHILHLLKTRENFHVFLTDEELESRYMVYAREEVGAIVAKTSAPAVILAINESNLSAAFWDYLVHLIGDNRYRYPDDAESERKLSEYIKRLKSS